MLELPCPFCGPRAEIEFDCSGPAGVARPAPPAQVDNRRWSRYLYYTPDSEEWLAERWCHRHGCGLWFEVFRHVRTHQVSSSNPAHKASTDGDLA